MSGSTQFLPEKVHRRIALSDRLLLALTMTPVMAYFVGGTTLTGADEALLAYTKGAAVPVTFLGLTALISLSRRIRAVYGAALIIWWAVWIYTRVTAEQPLSLFGLLAFVTVPVIVALTFGKVWASDDDVAGRDAR
jgi:hypothetical protein